MKLGIIGGTGSSLLFDTVDGTSVPDETPFGRPTSDLYPVEFPGCRAEIAYVARHGVDGAIPPHRVNYRANLWMLKQFEPDLIIGLNAVGGIEADALPGRLYFPDQLIDYTWGRQQTYSDGKLAPLQHVDFTAPFDDTARRLLVDSSERLGLEYSATGTYGVTQGPRLETAAEIDRLERDGCTIVGMTAMPEAALARELGLPYAICALVVNRAPGRGEPGADIHDEMQRTVRTGMEQVGRLLAAL